MEKDVEIKFKMVRREGDEPHDRINNNRVSLLKA
jgi:hypothetical protein